MKLFLKFLNSNILEGKYKFIINKKKTVEIKLIKILFMAILFLIALKVSLVF